MVGNFLSYIFVKGVIANYMAIACLWRLQFTMSVLLTFFTTVHSHEHYGQSSAFDTFLVSKATSVPFLKQKRRCG